MRDYRHYVPAFPSAPVVVQNTAPEVVVDPSRIETAVASAMRGWQPMVSVGGRDFYGVMTRTMSQRRRR